MKKVISVILALALCISLVPVAFAVDTGIHIPSQKRKDQYSER